MSRDQAARISASGTTVDVGEATTRYLLYGLLPSWFVPGLADWVMHRRTRIEDTAGIKESVIHSLMMAEIGIPIAATLRYRVNPALLAVQLGGAAVHEATALWDVRTAVHSGREVKPIEQHIHSFLESLPFGALASLMCLHSDQVRSLLRGGRGDPDAWRLVPRRPQLSRGYLAGITAAIGACVLLPYAEELLRCGRAAKTSKKEVETSCASHS
ncbi:diguanylate cyclase [Streptomyces sp. NBC_00028]|uniref:diguanylate cyclase n=1 Tax=Streptomyces sp. NBC_00028 TaxID=2975624 RepID=UPI00324BA420